MKCTWLQSWSSPGIVAKYTSRPRPMIRSTNSVYGPLSRTPYEGLKSHGPDMGPFPPGLLTAAQVAFKTHPLAPPVLITGDALA